MVGVAGFEPATPSSRTRCATRLRYTPTGGRSYNHDADLPASHEEINDRRAGNTGAEGRCRGHRRGDRLPGGGRAGRLPDRDRLWARRRRPQWRGGGPALCRQGAAPFQPADRPCGGPRRRAGARPLQRRCRAAGGRLLAGTSDAGAAQGSRMSGIRTGAGRARQRGVKDAGASGRPCAAHRVRRAGGGALGQPLRPCLADRCRACAGRPARAHRSHRRWRPLHGGR